MYEMLAWGLSIFTTDLLLGYPKLSQGELRHLERKNEIKSIVTCMFK